MQKKIWVTYAARKSFERKISQKGNIITKYPKDKTFSSKYPEFATKVTEDPGELKQIMDNEVWINYDNNEENI